VALWYVKVVFSGPLGHKENSMAEDKIHVEVYGHENDYSILCGG
jgi:hypothetical protein